MATANGDCIACNERDGERYSLRLHGREGSHKNIDPTLCEVCAGEHLALDWIKRRVTPNQD